MQYFKLYPFDDRHRYHRPAALIAARGNADAVTTLLDWLEPDPSLDGFAQADTNTLRAFGIRPPPRKKA